MAASPENADAQTRRRLTIALILSLLILLTGIVWTLRIGQQSRRISLQLAETRDGLEAMQVYLRKQKGGQQ